MFRTRSWYRQPPRNFAVDKTRQRIWRRWAKYYRTTDEFRLLELIEAKCQHEEWRLTKNGRDVFWLLPYRTKLRRVIARLKRGSHLVEFDAIRYYMAYCPEEMIPFCIWLIGKCANEFRPFGIMEFCRYRSPQVRRQLAKALWRLQAWWLLEEMAKCHPEDERLRYFSSSRPRRQPFNERLSKYVKTVDDSNVGEVVTPSRMPYWAIEKSWDYTPPKSVELIRRMLRRIRHWVRWGVN